MARKRIGELLVERGAITRGQLEAALEAQKTTRARLGATLIQQGIISEPQLATVLAQSLSIPVVDLTVVQVDWSAVHMLRAAFCEQHELFPFGIEGKRTPTRKLMVALTDPLNEGALNEIEFTTGLTVAPHMSTHSQVRDAIVRFYHKGSAPPPRPPGPEVTLEPAPVFELEAPDVVVGEEIISSSTIVPMPIAPLYSFGGGSDETIEKLEKKFWALMRVLQRKGLVTREEFMKELGED